MNFSIQNARFCALFPISANVGFAEFSFIIFIVARTCSAYCTILPTYRLPYLLFAEIDFTFPVSAKPLLRIQNSCSQIFSFNIPTALIYFQCKLQFSSDLDVGIWSSKWKVTEELLSERKQRCSASSKFHWNTRQTTCLYYSCTCMHTWQLYRTVYYCGYCMHVTDELFRILNQYFRRLKMSSVYIWNLFRSN